MNYENHHPFGIDPTEQQIVAAVEQASKVYKEIPETTCCSRCECCNAACPNMYYAEFLSIRRGAVDKMTPEQRLNLTVECVRRYLQSQTELKPCLFLKEKLCSIYDVRHLKCRLYGLIPASLYERNVDSEAKETGLPRNQLPLCQQCPNVKVKPELLDKFPDGHVTEASIKSMELRMKQIDRNILGITQDTQDQGMGFLTYHDWHLLYEFGPAWMANLTQLRLKLNAASKEHFVQALKTALEKRLTETKPEENENAKQ